MEACSRSQRENFYDSIWDVSRRHILFTFARNSMFQLTTQKFFSSSCHLSCFDSKSSVPQTSTLCRCHPINTHVRLTLPTARRPVHKKKTIPIILGFASFVYWAYDLPAIVNFSNHSVVVIVITYKRRLSSCVIGHVFPFSNFFRT